MQGSVGIEIAFSLASGSMAKIKETHEGPIDDPEALIEQMFVRAKERTMKVLAEEEKDTES